VINRKLTYQNFCVLKEVSLKKRVVVEKKCCKYTYDNLTGLSNNSFNMGDVRYDANGNITGLDRNGQNNQIDALQYTYDNGNKLLKITDDSNKNQGFIDGNTIGNDYIYDTNSNLISDKNKGITNIVYNHLNLIEEVNFNDGKKIKFIYNAVGEKLQKQFINGTSTTVTDYLGGFQYQNGILHFFPTQTGYVTPDISNNGTFTFVNIYTDQLKNNRLSFADIDGSGSISNSEILSSTSYYPMGLIHNGEYISSVASNYNFKFQGKEYQPENGLNLYDFGSRMYDPATGRWFSVDPQSQFASPYVAMGNNYIVAVDPDGEFVLIVALAAGALNLGLDAIQGNVDNFLDGALSFASGFASGAFAEGKLGKALLYATSSTALSHVNINVPVGPISTFSLSPNIAFGTDKISFGLNSAISTNGGPVSVGFGFGADYVSKGSAGSAKNSFETRLSGSGGLGYKNFGVSIYETSFRGNDKNLRPQRVGGVGINIGEFGLRYENDGAEPFDTLLDLKGSDSYRTGAASISYGDISFGVNIFTGKRNLKKESDLDGPDKASRKNLTFEVFVNEKTGKIKIITHRYGLTIEDGPKFRLGAAYIGYKNFRAGINSQRVIHATQGFIHNNVTHERSFKITSWDVKPYLQYQTVNPFTLW